MFNNQIFDSWLNHKADEILSKVNRETITTEEMIVLILKAQTNHFYHMDQETKEDMTNLRTEMRNLKVEMKEFKTEMHQDMDTLRSEMKEFKAEIRQDMDTLRSEMKEFKAEIRQDMAEFKAEIRQDMAEFKAEMKEEFKKVDTKFMWSTGITVTMFLGLYLKLFLG